MLYKNCSLSVKTFYGVEFQTNEIKEVPGFINDINFVRVLEEDSSEKPRRGRKPKLENLDINESSDIENGITEVTEG